MTRGVGEIEVVSGLPETAAVFVALVTALGDAWFVFGLLGVLYWFGPALPGPLSLPRRAAAFVIALALGGLAVTTALKEVFGLSRPPGAGETAGGGAIPEAVLPLYAEIGAASGFGFPSGHAVSAVVVYGGLGLLIGSRRSYATAVALCVFVPLSRIVLGVHYLVDIVVGLGVGAAYLGLVYRLCGRGAKPGRAMLLALTAALAGAATGYTTDTMLALGGTLGARMAWGILGGAALRAPTTPAVGAVGTVVGLAFGGLLVVVYVLDPAPYVSFLGIFAVVWGVIAAPLAGEAVAERL